MLNLIIKVKFVYQSIKDRLILDGILKPDRQFFVDGLKHGDWIATEQQKKIFLDIYK